MSRKIHALSILSSFLTGMVTLSGLRVHRRRQAVARLMALCNSARDQVAHCRSCCCRSGNEWSYALSLRRGLSERALARSDPCARSSAGRREHSLPALFILSRLLQEHQLKALERQKPVYLSAPGFAAGWEPVGTGFAWSYPEFSFYVWNGVPVALVLAWPFWLTCIAIVAQALLGDRRTSGLGRRRVVLVAAIGALVGFFVEVTGVGLGWWAYLQPISPNWSIFAFSGYIHVITFAGWGLIAGVITGVADLFGWLRSRIGTKKSLALLFVISIPIGAALFFFLGVLYIALP